MSFLQRLFNKNKKVNRPDILRDFSTNGIILTGHEPTAFSCIDKIANSIALLSFAVHDNTTRQKLPNHWLYDLVKFPNIDEGHALFFTQIVRDYYNGNVFLYKAFDGNQVISLFRMNPRQVQVTRNELNQKKYTYNGTVYSSREVLHIPSRWGYNGLKGKSIFDECSRVFTTAQELDQYTNNAFKNNLGKRLIIDLTNALPDATDDQKDKISQKYVDKYGGVDGAGKPIVKTSGIEFSSVDSGASTNQASQLSENRDFQMKVIAQLFHVPLDLLSGQAPQNMESFFQLYTTYAVEPIATALEQAINSLLPVEERQKVFFEFNYASLLKTSLQTRIDSYSKQIMNGMLSPDEARQKENMQPIGGQAGNTKFIPANLMPLTDGVIDAYMASAKEKAAKNINKDSTGIGDDKK